MSMGFGELEANNDSNQNIAKVARKPINLKLKRDPVDEPTNQMPVKESKCQADSLNWNYKVKLSGEKKSNKLNLLNFCEKCKRPILVHGRLIPCKHFLCLNCAQKGTRNCFKCDTPIKGIQPVPKIYVCAHEGTRHSLTGCRKSYLNFLGLDQHQKLRHSEQGSALDPSIDSDGELSVNKQPQPAQPAQQQQQQQQQQPLPQQPIPQQASAAPPQAPAQFTMLPTTMASLPAVLPTARPLLFPPMQQAQQQAQSAAQAVMNNSTRLTFAHPTPRPTAVLLFPRPQLAVTSMASLLIPPRGITPPQMLTLPGMLPQPAGMMPMPPQQFPGLPPQHLAEPIRLPTEALRLPTPPSLPMPEQMRDVGRSRDTPPPLGRDFTPPTHEQTGHFSPDTAPPPPPPRNLRSDPREEFRGGFPGGGPRDPRVGSPRDPRKVRDVPPPPPPKNGTVR